MSEMKVLILIYSIVIPFWLFILLSLVSVIKSIIDHSRKINKPFKIKKGLVASFNSSVIFGLCFGGLTFLIYFANQELEFIRYWHIPYYTGAVSLGASIYYYAVNLKEYRNKGVIMNILKAVSNSVKRVWK